MPLYFAYGSNMDAAAMAARCPGSRQLGCARLARHRLVVMAEGYLSLLRDPRHEQAVVNELRAVAEEVAADPRYADDEQMGPDDEARERFREFARKQLG